MDDMTRVYSCTCGAFKFHELLPHAEKIRTDPEAGFEHVGRCKHRDAVAVEDREASQQGSRRSAGTPNQGPITMTEPESKAIVVLTQEEIDTAIHGLEEASVGMDREQFKEVYGDVYRKLHAIGNEGDNEYRVK